MLTLANVFSLSSNLTNEQDGAVTVLYGVTFWRWHMQSVQDQSPPCKRLVS